ncbi:MAG: hypothetical protein AB7K24_01290 [Gemmataceae bacterium]
MQRIVPVGLVALLLCSCGSSKEEEGPKKQIARWQVKVGESGVATSLEAYQRYEKLSAAKDELKIQQLALKGELFSVTRGTEVEMLENDLLVSKIRVKSGPQAGREGYLATEHVERVFLRQ